MKGLKLWYTRTFLVINIDYAKKLGLEHVRNIYGDEINHINCRSIWQDNKGRTYRVHELFRHWKENRKQ